MGVDTEKYTQALEDFLIKMEQIEEIIDPGTEEALRSICTFLRIARVDVLFYEPHFEEYEDMGREIIFYEDGAWDRERVYCLRETAGGGNMVVYRLFQRAGDTDWSDTEKEKITILARMLYTFNGRVRVMQMAEEIVHRDPDLGCYNLNYFIRMAENAIEEKKIGRYAACYFNLKGFSVINQQLGREQGTRIMQLFAKGFQERLGDTGYVCRVTGDRFAVLFLKESMETVMAYLKGTEIHYGGGTGKKIFVEATVGYYNISEPDVCQKATDIIDCITTAEHIAANVVHKAYVFFDDSMRESRSEAKKIESEFRNAVSQEEFLVYYQPKVGLKDYRLAGAEALCRWFHNGSLVPPFRFIPVLEQSQAICELDFYMLEHVCRDISRWLQEGKEVVKVSVNFSRRHMGNKDLTEHILDIIDRYNVPHQYIEIELTETTTDVEFRDLRRIVSGLQLQGISTAVDDFGVGYSSLNLIRELPWDVLKIDKSFLPTTDDDSDQKNVMFKYLIAMAQNLGLECIVEGVETVEQVRILKENNCYMAQGFYFDKPLPVEDFEGRLLVRTI